MQVFQKLMHYILPPKIDLQKNCPLHSDVLIQIFLECDFTSQLNCFRTCKLWKQLLDHETIWTQVTLKLGIKNLKIEGKSSKQTVFMWHSFQHTPFLLDFPLKLLWRIHELPQYNPNTHSSSVLYQGLEKSKNAFLLIIQKPNSPLFTMQLYRIDHLYWLSYQAPDNASATDRLDRYLDMIKFILEQQHFSETKKLFQEV